MSDKQQWVFVNGSPKRVTSDEHDKIQAQKDELQLRSEADLKNKPGITNPTRNAAIASEMDLDRRNSEKVGKGSFWTNAFSGWVLSALAIVVALIGWSLFE